MNTKNKVLIYGGGTVSHVRNHLALCAPAYGTFARELGGVLEELNSTNRIDVDVRLTKMAGGDEIETSDELMLDLLDELENPDLAVVVMNAAVCDYYGTVGNTESGKYAERLKSREGDSQIDIIPNNKIIPMIKQQRPDIFVVAFKTTCGFGRLQQDCRVIAAYDEGHADLVIGNDTETRRNVIFSKEGLKVVENREHLVNLLAVKTHNRTVNKEKHMYFEEQTIDGILCYRHNPHGEFTPYTAEELTTKLGNVQGVLDSIKKQVHDLG